MEKEMKIILEGEKGIYTKAILGYAFLPFLFDDEPYCIRQLEQSTAGKPYLVVLPVFLEEFPLQYCRHQSPSSFSIQTERMLFNFFGVH